MERLEKDEQRGSHNLADSALVLLSREVELAGPNGAKLGGHRPDNPEIDHMSQVYPIKHKCREVGAHQPVVEIAERLRCGQEECAHVVCQYSIRLIGHILDVILVAVTTRLFEDAHLFDVARAVVSVHVHNGSPCRGILVGSGVMVFRSGVLPCTPHGAHYPRFNPDAASLRPPRRTPQMNLLYLER